MKRLTAFLSQFFRKFLHDGLPVALAGGIGTMAFGHFAQTPALPESPPIAKETNEELLRLMREEHAVILDVLKNQSQSSALSSIGQVQEKQQPALAHDDSTAKSHHGSVTPRPVQATKPVQNPVSPSVADPLPITPNMERPSGSLAASAERDEAPSLAGRLWSHTTRVMGEVMAPIPFLLPRAPIGF